MYVLPHAYCPTALQSTCTKLIYACEMLVISSDDVQEEDKGSKI